MPISDEVEVKMTQGDVAGSKEAFQKLIIMSKEVVESSNGAVNSLENEQDAKFKVGFYHVSIFFVRQLSEKAFE